MVIGLQNDEWEQKMNGWDLTGSYLLGLLLNSLGKTIRDARQSLAQKTS